ncbi:hypothetical protein X278_05585 [Oenococcus oeni IOEB_0205]|nr:hypothetical protein X278_05585 [Oenococcus oeni IOEB_0205]
MILIVVDLPAPLGPMKAKTSPEFTSKLISFKALKLPKFFANVQYAALLSSFLLLKTSMNRQKTLINKK